MADSALTARLDKLSQAELRAALETLPLEVQDKVAKSALRQFARYEMPKIASMNGRWLNPKHLAYRQKNWPSGIAWVGVGYRLPGGMINFQGKGRARRAEYDNLGVGWRSHFTELGFHTWPKGIEPPERGRGRGWKKGLRHRGVGGYHRGTKASEIVHNASSLALLSFLKREVQFFIEKATIGRRARRTRIK